MNRKRFHLSRIQFRSTEIFRFKIIMNMLNITKVFKSMSVSLHELKKRKSKSEKNKKVYEEEAFKLSLAYVNS